MANVLMEGMAQKAAGDKVRIAADFGNEPLLIQGYSITSQNVTCADGSPPTISGIQLDYAYQVSALFDGGTAGTQYNIVFTIVLDDPDASEIARTGILSVL